MKKYLLLIVLITNCLAISASVPDVEEVKETYSTSAKSQDKYSHWSIMLSGGFNMLITERQGDWDEYKWMGRDYSNKGMWANFEDNFAPAAIFQADYMFTPQFGLRFEYLYAPINKKAIYLDDQVDITQNKFFSDENGQSHQISLQLEMNMLNIFYRCRQNKRWGWYIGGGVGAMFYKIPKFEKYRPIVTIPINTSIEYSPINSLSVVLHAEFDWYGDDELNGYDIDDQVNDMGLYVGLGLRYNIDAIKKPHVRVNDMCSFEPLHVSKATNTGKNKFKDSETTQEDLEELQDKMDELEKRNRELSDKIELMNREIMERMDKYFNDTPNGNDGNKESTKGDSSKDKDKKGSKKDKDSKGKDSSTKSKSSIENEYNSARRYESSTKETRNDYGRPKEKAEEENEENGRGSYQQTETEIKQQQIYTEAMMSNGTEANEVIFDLESSRVKSKFEVKIAAVAKRMIANKKLKLDIFAYIKKDDLTKANVKLATQRMEAIYYILVNRYQIDQNRVKYDILEPAEGDESADIRCDMVYR